MATVWVPRRVMAVLLVLGSVGISARAVAQPPAAALPPPTPPSRTPPPVYNGIIAGWEAYFRGETERQQAIGTQLSANDAAAWYAGAPTTVPYPPDLETAYALAPTTAYRPGSGRLVYAHRGWTGVFEPWPLVPGDLYTPYFRRVAQPVANSITPLGPNGYFARSVYPADLAAQRAARRAAPPAAEASPGPAPGPALGAPNGGSWPPAATTPAPGKPAPEAIPAPSPEGNGSGPREF